MNKTGRALAAFCTLAALAWATTLGQEVNPFEGIDKKDPLAALEEAPDHERGAKRQDLIEAVKTAPDEVASNLVQQLIARVENRRELEDKNLVGQCILALGSLRENEATDVLLDALEARNMQIAYQAAIALGQIWEGKGLGDAQAREVTVELLTVLYSPLPPLTAYGPGLALCRINGIQDVDTADGLPPGQLLSTIDQWVLANRDRLPAAGNAPWQLLLRTVLASQNQAARQEALQALLQQRSLGPVDPILDALQEGSVPQNLQNSLTDLLSRVTGVSYPPAGLQEDQDPVAAWRKQWYARLKTDTGEKYTRYAWNALERTLTDYLAEPTEAKAEQIKELRSVILYQLPGADTIPDDASPTALSLLEEPLKSKRIVASAVGALQDPQSSEFQKDQNLTAIEQETSKPHGQEVGEQFLEPLARLAYEEGNFRFAERLGNILWTISGIPLQLDDRDQQVRRQRLQAWRDALRKKHGIALDFGQ